MHPAEGSNMCHVTATETSLICSTPVDCYHVDSVSILHFLSVGLQNDVVIHFSSFQSDVNTVAFADESGHLIYSGSDDTLCKVTLLNYVN